MKILIVYYSRTNTTKTIALELQQKLNADIEMISAPELKLGFWGYMKAGHQAAAKKKVRIESSKFDPSEYDLVIIGTPVWVGTLTSPVRTYLQENADSFKKVAFFCTCGSNQNKTFGEMEKECGKKPIATLELKAIEVNYRLGNFEKAAGKCQALIQEYPGSKYAPIAKQYYARIKPRLDAASDE